MRFFPIKKAYVRDGVVFPGDTPEMTYIALGNPTAVETKQKGDVTVEMWTYKKYYPSGEFADFLTQYSLSRNPNLLRELNVESGKVNVSVNAPAPPGEAKSLFDTATGQGNDLSLPDIPIYNLYVFFHNQKVVDVKIESMDQTKFMWLQEAIEMEERAKD